MENNQKCCSQFNKENYLDICKKFHQSYLKLFSSYELTKEVLKFIQICKEKTKKNFKKDGIILEKLIYDKFILTQEFINKFILVLENTIESALFENLINDNLTDIKSSLQKTLDKFTKENENTIQTMDKKLDLIKKLDSDHRMMENHRNSYLNTNSMRIRKKLCGIIDSYIFLGKDDDISKKSIRSILQEIKPKEEEKM